MQLWETAFHTRNLKKPSDKKFAEMMAGLFTLSDAAFNDLVREYPGRQSDLWTRMGKVGFRPDEVKKKLYPGNSLSQTQKTALYQLLPGVAIKHGISMVGPRAGSAEEHAEQLSDERYDVSARMCRWLVSARQQQKKNAMARTNPARQHYARTDSIQYKKPIKA
jgi:hypothetical protein